MKADIEIIAAAEAGAEERLRWQGFRDLLVRLNINLDIDGPGSE